VSTEAHQEDVPEQLRREIRYRLEQTTSLTKMIGATTKTTKPKIMTSSTTRYMIHRIPNVSHQRWGEENRQVWIDVYSKMWAAGISTNR
jgi:hypothetical protein